MSPVNLQDFKMHPFKPLHRAVVHRTVVAGCLLATACLAGPATVQAAYPDRPVTLVVTYPAGGTADYVGRTIAPELAKQLGQSVIVENRGGAGGMIGGAMVARAAPDGYTIMLDAANHAQNPALHAKMQFDTLKDFAPVTLVMRVPNVLVVNPAFPVKTVPDLITLGKEPDKVVHYATSGPDSAQHLAGELFNALTGTHLEAVHYKGGSAGMMDVVGGQVPVMFTTMNLALQHSKSDKVRLIAVGSDKRSPNAPNVPTIAEAGVPGYESYEWNAIFVPTGTPAPIIEQVNVALRKVLAEPEVIARLNQIGAEVIGSTPAELETFRRNEIIKWQKLVKDHHLNIEQ